MTSCYKSLIKQKISKRISNLLNFSLTILNSISYHRSKIALNYLNKLCLARNQVQTSHDIHPCKNKCMTPQCWNSSNYQHNHCVHYWYTRRNRPRILVKLQWKKDCVSGNRVSKNCFSENTVSGIPVDGNHVNRNHISGIHNSKNHVIGNRVSGNQVRGNIPVTSAPKGNFVSFMDPE